MDEKPSDQKAWTTTHSNRTYQFCVKNGKFQKTLMEGTNLNLVMEQRPYFPGQLLMNSKNPIDRDQMIQILVILARRGQFHMNLFSNILETKYIESNDDEIKETDKFWYVLIGWTRTYDVNGMDLDQWCRQWMPLITNEIRSVQQWDLEAILNLDALAVNQHLINDHQLPLSPLELEPYWKMIVQSTPKNSLVSNWAQNLLDVIDELMAKYNDHFIKDGNIQ